jgi:hypothetical protein
VDSQFMFDKPFPRRFIALGAVMLAFATACSPGHAEHTPVTGNAHATQPPPAPPALPPAAVPTPDFAAVSTLVNDAIAAHKLPGAVVEIGHGGKVVFH